MPERKSPIGVAKIFLILIIIVMAIGTVALNFTFWPQRQKSLKSQKTDTAFQKISNDLAQTIVEFQADYDLTRRKINQAIESDNSNLNSDNLERINLEIKKKIIEKQSQSLKPKLNDLQKILPADWSYVLTPEFSAQYEALIFKIEFIDNQGCQVCPDSAACDAPTKISPRQTLLFYPLNIKDKVLQKIELSKTTNAPQQCQPEIFLETSDFLIIDSCSNDLYCSGREALDNALKNYLINTNNAENQPK